ncbi:VOC family protein [Kineosporia succinea]|uniref:Catechol 2,3-dioxygenase-like lactoylglutathione lyase family enzyme n=1 Tax=Kineosporia succinea TaxID=84632 RepID=A0ABT9P103_9ACTN|nr:VOC family protein [Kineosporia succinea]MDP9826353.1 catechol 2,3-dioxygenase-like lactoylglutathione lyase family enzyme [Kineosporia succinea]
MTLLGAVPSLPVFDIAAAVEFYTSKLPFRCRYQEAGLAILVSDAVELSLWAANRPDIPGGEPHLAGSASCSFRVDDATALHRTCEGIVHPNAPLHRTAWGTREFSVLDHDGNAIRFYEVL